MDGEGENVGVLCRVGEGIRWMVGGGRRWATGGDEDGSLNGKREVGGRRRR